MDMIITYTKRIIKVFENASNLEKEKVRLYWHDPSKSFVTYIMYIRILLVTMFDQSNIYISLINKTYESKLHKINSNIWYSPSPVSRAAHERDERALDTSLQIFRSESHVPPIYRPYVFHYVQISFHRLWHTIRVYQSPWTD